jgi:hypothetical protein
MLDFSLNEGMKTLITLLLGSGKSLDHWIEHPELNLRTISNLLRSQEIVYMFYSDISNINKLPQRQFIGYNFSTGDRRAGKLNLQYDVRKLVTNILIKRSPEIFF